LNYEDIHGLSTNDKKAEFTKTTEMMIKEILKAAHKIYDQDLASKDRADMIRNSLQILDNYKTLVYFPQNVDKCLAEEDYEQIITSYKAAQAQLSKIESTTRKSRLFAQIKTDLENKVLEVQKSILDRLVQFPSSPDDQKYLIDYYNALAMLSPSSGDKKIANDSPAWHCLTEEKKWFLQLMIECRDMHIADEKVSLALKQSNTDDSSSNKNSQLAHIDGDKVQNSNDELVILNFIFEIKR
jgi:hypothetical protein